MPGILLVIATPLGNLSDLSSRAIEALRRADCIACEDTRRTSKLLRSLDLRGELLSCHRFNEAARLEPVLERLRAGQTVALVSDGGTPAISDPGARLVRAALDQEIPVSPIPGPSAVATLLSVSGLPADRYVFEGYLPHREGDRRRRLRALRDETRTVVLFETPHRIRAALEDIAEVLGDRPLVLGRELTKLHETLLSGTASKLLEELAEPVKGEITLALAGADPSASPARTDGAAERVAEVWERALEASGGDRRLALRRAARELAMPRAQLYRRLAELDRQRRERPE